MAAGTVSTKELQTILTNLGMALSEKEVSKLVRKVDADGSGAVLHRQTGRGVCTNRGRHGAGPGRTSALPLRCRKEQRLDITTFH